MSRRGVMLAILAAAALAGGCGGEELQCPLQEVGGRITGTVRLAGLSSEGEIQARDLSGSNVFERDLREDGTYELDLPAGDYRLKLNLRDPYATYQFSATGLLSNDGPADTVTVQPGSHRTIDWNLGSLTFDLAVDTGALQGELGLAVHRLGTSEDATPGDDVVRTTAAVSNGRLRTDLPGLRPGRVRLEIYNSGTGSYSQAERFWWPGESEVSASPIFRVGADSLTTIAGELTLTPSTVAGRIGGAWSSLQLLHRPWLKFFTPDSTEVLATDDLLPDGSFELPLLLSRPFKAWVGRGGTEGWWLGGGTFETAPLFTPEAGGELRLPETEFAALRLDLTEAGRSLMISGGIKVSFHDASDGRLLHVTSEYPDDDGILLPLIHPGAYLLHIDSVSWGLNSLLPQWYDRAFDMAGASPVTIPADGSLVEVAATLVSGGSLSGTVLRPLEGPSLYTYAIATMATDPMPLGERYVFLSGEFEILGLPDGGYRLGCAWRPTTWDTPWDTLWYPGTERWEEADVLEIQDAGAIEGLLLDLRSLD